MDLWSAACFIGFGFYEISRCLYNNCFYFAIVFLFNMGEKRRIAEIGFTAWAAELPLARGSLLAFSLGVESLLITHDQFNKIIPPE